MGRTKTDSSIPSSYSADYFQRGKDYAEKLRRGWYSPSLFLSLKQPNLVLLNSSVLNLTYKWRPREPVA